MRELMKRSLLAAVFTGVLLIVGHEPQAAVPEGIWLIPGKVAVRVFECSGLLCGSVVWLRDAALRTPALCRRTIIWGLQPNGDNRWSSGWFFDPANGRTYDLSAQLISADTITAQIYLSLPFLGRTETLHRTTLSALPEPC